MRTPVQSRSEASSEAMLDATLDLLAQGGTAAVTVAAVARAAGASNGSLYHRFGDRRGLLLAAQDRALTRVEAEAAVAFAEAHDEPDDDRATTLLAGVALAIFERHRGAVRPFLVDPDPDGAFAERTARGSHLLADTVTGWLRERLGADEADAEAAWRMLFALGAASALFDDPRVSPAGVAPDAMARAVGRAVVGVVRRR
ncbi:transcriptional regulator BetI [Nocardioides dokdonensis FR1436]|uniref:Transcriptional regulator BetI n=1 Tax=Nocardioides dokdonensis FR1436 TaxID=1300347 RepID=A0A1A9GLV1_9ACTN|nr:TetR family transcriptional regulator [Nocardioides dokdonensis]ANH38642.1 transcriptional regulator BetI [Nocardioides dokdonensis FR1436]